MELGVGIQWHRDGYERVEGLEGTEEGEGGGLSSIIFRSQSLKYI